MQGTTPYDFLVQTKLTTHNCTNDKLFNDIDYQHADGKKSAWVPDKSTGGYLEGLCENDMKVAKKNETTEMKMLKEISLHRWPRITKQQQ